MRAERTAGEGSAPAEPGMAPANPEPAPADPVFDGARLAALADLGLLDTGPDEDFDRYTRLAGELLGVPISLVSLVGADRQFFKSAIGLGGVWDEARETPLSHSFCRHTVATQKPLVVSDAREHPLVADNLGIRDLGVIAYAGMPLVLSDGNAVGAFCAIDAQPREWSERELRILSDLAEAVRAHLELRRALAEQTLHDRLTGLPNRALLAAQAEILLSGAGAGGERPVAAICVGVDGFRLFNEAYGAAGGDVLLAQIGRRLAGALRPGDMLGRLGGDVFAVVSADVEDADGGLELARRLRELIVSKPFDVESRSLGVTVTTGLAMGIPGSSGADLLAQADDSMRRAKESGGWLRAAPAGAGDIAAAQLRMRAALATALARGELEAAFQPIVDLDSGHPRGYETLARWTNPEIGRVSPVEFIPAAERSGGIVPIGEWALHEACNQLAAWRAAGDKSLSVSVNVSPIQLGQANLVQVVDSALAASSLPPSALVIEITETALIGAEALQSNNLHGLRSLGVRIALDDFGTGYSALGYLKRFPIDEIKIDRSFIEGFEVDRHNTALVQAIIALAAGLEMDVVAEGIETPEQCRLLKLLGCRLGQGYLFAAPQPAAAVGVGGPEAPGIA